MKNGDFPVRDVNVYQRVNPLWVASFFFAESSPVGQEEKIQQMERLFSPRLLGATVPRGRLLKCHVSKDQWQTWNRTLDLLQVEDQEPTVVRIGRG